jgi:hypothetical protein
MVKLAFKGNDMDVLEIEPEVIEIVPLVERPVIDSDGMAQSLYDDADWTF